MNDDNLFPCLICNTPIDYDYSNQCPHCGWIIQHFLGDETPDSLEEIAQKYLLTHRQHYVEKHQLNVTDFSWTGYSKDLEKAMNEKNKSQSAEAQDAEMQTQFKPKIIQPLPKPIVSQQNDSIYSTYCDFMGRLYDRQYSSEDLNLLLNQDIRLKYLFGLSLEDILNEEESNIMQCLANSQVTMNYLCKLPKLVKIFAKSNLMMNQVIQSEIAMNEIVKSEVAMTFFITSNQNLVQFGYSDIAIQAIVNSDLAMSFIKNNANCFSSLCQKISSVSISKLALKIIDFNPESFDHFDDVVNSSEAMNAIANSEIAMKAIANSEIAMKAVANSEIAMKAVANSEIAMNAIANSEVAMKAIIVLDNASKLIE